jgi:hypothetical protein
LATLLSVPGGKTVPPTTIPVLQYLPKEDAADARRKTHRFGDASMEVMTFR